jgi:hypothetical protein
MAHTQKKMAAALAAVNAYLEMEEMAAQQEPVGLPEPELHQNYWSQSARQEMMTMRRLIQLRTFANYR